MAREVAEKIYAGQTLSTGKKGAVCVSDKHSGEESRSLLLGLPPKSSGISLLKAKACSRQEKVMSQFGFGKHRVLLAAWMRAVTSLHVGHVDLSGC